MAMLPPPPGGSTSSNGKPAVSPFPAPDKGHIPSSKSEQEGTPVFDWDDEEGWQDMPVVRSGDLGRSDSSSSDDDNSATAGPSTKRKNGLKKASRNRRRSYQPPARLAADDDDESGAHHTTTSGTGNATGASLAIDDDVRKLAGKVGMTSDWREKLSSGADELDYTRLRLAEDEESEEVHMRTRYLFDDAAAMTPLSQAQATKRLLEEGQRIAYVGLCALIARELVRDTGRGMSAAAAGKKGKGSAAEPEAVVAARMWMVKVMARLYQHMDLDADEQRMIDSLAEHGVDPSDLVPALMTTHTIRNPEYDPAEVKRQQERDTEEAEEQARVVKESAKEGDAAKEPESKPKSEPRNRTRGASLLSQSHKPINPFGDDDDDEEEAARPLPSKQLSTDTKKSINPFGDDDDEDNEALPRPAPSRTTSGTMSIPKTPVEEVEADIGAPALLIEESSASTGNALAPQQSRSSQTTNLPPSNDGAREMPIESQPLPGVSTSLSRTDENVTLDIRWTILCDLFLQLIADSVYDSRSRAFLQRVAGRLGLTWLDVTRFEKRVTDALEIQEGVERLEQDEVIAGRVKQGKRRRYAMMGLATLGGGLVIGLSAGLLAPVIGAGIGAAFATVGITGTTGFLAGAGGAAVITTGGVITGSTIGGKGMMRRTRNVRTFEFKPIHNNKRVNCFITVPGFMASMVDDVRLPYSTLDPIIGDVFALHWEPEMMNEMGNALKILTSEVLTQVGQTVLQATVMTALMSALQWPLILTKLGYLIDNPWSNALDRSYAAGLVLADTLIARHAGVRPISLIGFSLGARVIFYALEELAKQKAYGIVDEVYLFGATVTASKQTWLQVRSVVAGKFVNGFATSDWLLAYLFRLTSGGLDTVAGMRPVENVPGLENVDVTDMIQGHLSYRAAMPALLEHVGLPITADWFDEPDDPELDMSVQERIIINEAEEELAKERARTKIWGIFPRKKAAAPKSGRSTPMPVQQPPSFQTDKDAKPGSEYTDADADDDDDSRTEVGGDKAGMSTPRSGESSIDIPKTAGFDFKAISKVLGKDVDPSHVKLEMPKEVTTPNGTNLRPAQPPLARSESAPPPAETSLSETSEPAWPKATPPSLPRHNTSANLPEASTPIAAPAPRPFPSHVLQSAASIINANHFEADRGFATSHRTGFDDRADEDGDVGGFGRNDDETRPISSRKDDLQMENPW